MYMQYARRHPGSAALRTAGDAAVWTHSAGGNRLLRSKMSSTVQHRRRDHLRHRPADVYLSAPHMVVHSILYSNCLIFIRPSLWWGPYIYYIPAPRVEGIKRWCASDVCLSDICLTSICLSRTGLTREQRPSKTKIGTEVANVTRDSDTTFKFKRSKVNLQGAYCGGLPHSLFIY